MEERTSYALYQYIKTISATMTEKRTVDVFFSCSIDHWMQLTLFMGEDAQRALNLPRSTQPMTNFVKSHMDHPTKKLCIPAKAEAVSPSEISITWPQPPSLPRLGMRRHANNITEPPTRPKHPRQTTLRKIKRIGIGTHLAVSIRTPIPIHLDISCFFQTCPDSRMFVTYSCALIFQ